MGKMKKTPIVPPPSSENTTDRTKASDESGGDLRGVPTTYVKRSTSTKEKSTADISTMLPPSSTVVAAKKRRALERSTSGAPVGAGRSGKEKLSTAWKRKFTSMVLSDSSTSATSGAANKGTRAAKDSEMDTDNDDYLDLSEAPSIRQRLSKKRRRDFTESDCRK